MTALSRRSLLGASLASVLAPVLAAAQTYPAKPITIIIGYTPGAVSDLGARTIAEGLQQAWGQTVIVDNRPGSGGNIGAVSRGAPAARRRLHADGRHRRADGEQRAPLQARRASIP